MIADTSKNVIADLFADNDNTPIDPNEFWKSLDLTKLPENAADGRERGTMYFFSGEECPYGHLSPRYTRGGKCVVCTRFTSASLQGQVYKGNASAARANITRAIASMSMSRTYIPSRPCKHGHMLRFVSSNNCVECDLIGREKHKETAKERRLIKEYGMDFAARKAMAESQEFKCPICTEEFTDTRTMHIDHCHNSGKVRGLLCALCNQAIGLLKENPEAIRRAAEYVENAAA